uniref:Uncharacterized protein n=1 Tax=Anguilla anguilla TaxID=7936 RepID=A0A0E9PY97_ANGAN
MTLILLISCHLQKNRNTG